MTSLGTNSLITEPVKVERQKKHPPTTQFSSHLSKRKSERVGSGWMKNLLASLPLQSSRLQSRAPAGISPIINSSGANSLFIECSANKRRKKYFQRF